MKVHILHANDVHSQLENHMRVGCALRTLRSSLESQGEPVLTFDIGDVMDRVRPETEASLGQVNAALLRALGVDAWVFGNNEGLTVPVDGWAELVQNSGALVFGTNIRDSTGSPLPYFTDLKMYDVCGLKLGVFGVTPNYAKPYEYLGVHVLDPVTEADRAVRTLRRMGAHVVVVLSHLGLRADRNLATTVPGIDVILGGHTHHFMDEPVYEGRTAIFQVGKHAIAFGHTTLTIDDDTKELLAVTGSAIQPATGDPLDSSMEQALNAYLPEIRGRLDESVCELDKPLQTSLERESTFANLLAGVLWEAYPSDLGFVVSGLLNASLLAGEVKRRHLHGACQTPTRPIRLTLTGRQLWNVFERGLQPEITAARGFGFGFRGSSVGGLGFANVHVTGQVKPAGDVRLEEVRIGDQPIDLDKFYRVTTCEYLWLSSVFPEVQQGTDVEIPPPLLRDLLMRHIGDKNIQSDAGLQRVHLSFEQV
ncbi:bifunctional metallophosphatase/5'-nucleotidase [Alicyclobacillus ferrooxydans]|uniref:Metallophosphoesterase n=1 Tax=Alicyclobacillus ferrooxydans TaxID=471514 RepID=A0A0P9CJG2_9BACL|nr:5'-nucleotidase C-terminal domain-containing protein [Alicyclobacillus ferrooxydans]KPV45465.1 hypothetical protein AN477_00400 [Alicyclobacillus ferrooxydans]